MARPRKNTARRARNMWVWPLEGLPELYMLGRDNLRAAGRLLPHTHAGIMEICYIERGTVTWWVGREVHEVEGGEVFITWPDEHHGGVDGAFHPSKLYWLGLVLPRKMKRGYLGLPAAEAARIHEGLWTLARRRFAAPAALARTLDRVFAALAGGTDALSVADARTSAVTFLLDVIRHGRRPAEGPAPERARRPELRRAVAVMDRHLEDPMPLPEIARRIGYSVSHFKQCFRAETGQSPGEFYLKRRLAAARAAIADSNEPLVMIAQRFGFNSSQYMANCFKRITGRTPSSYRTQKPN